MQRDAATAELFRSTLGCGEVNIQYRDGRLRASIRKCALASHAIAASGKHHDLAFESPCHRVVLRQSPDTNKKCSPPVGPLTNVR